MTLLSASWRNLAHQLQGRRRCASELRASYSNLIEITFSVSLFRSRFLGFGSHVVAMFLDELAKSKALPLPGCDQSDFDLSGDEEYVVGGIGYAAFLADVRGITAGCGCFATLGVDALDECDTREDALSVMANHRD